MLISSSAWAQWRAHGCAALALWTLSTSPVWADTAVDASAVQALSITGAAPRIDGKLDEAAWRKAPLHEHFVELHPVERSNARWRTTVQVLATEDALVFGIRAWDPSPELLRAPLVRRDHITGGHDHIAVFLDPSGARRHAQFVRVSASGVLADGVFSAQDDEEDYAADFDVQAAVQRLSDGYSVELRWPLSQLRHPPAGQAPWRMMVLRRIARDDAPLLVSVPLTQSALSFLSELAPITGLDEWQAQAAQHQFVQWRPELTWRRQRQTDAHQPSAPFQQKVQLGMNVKWQPRSDWVLDATLKPDFSQVDQDQPQLSANTRFALFQQEKRPFFLESQELTGQAPTDPDDNPRGLAGFYSRAITQPDWGLRASWRGARSQATAMSLRDQGGGIVLRPSAYSTRNIPQDLPSQASFARVHHQWSPSWDSAALLSHRDYLHGRANSVLGTSLSVQPGSNAMLRAQSLWSRTSVAFDDEGRGQPQSPQLGHRLWLQGRQRLDAWTGEVNLERISAGFANDNGFVPQSGVLRQELNLERKLEPPAWPEHWPLWPIHAAGWVTDWTQVRTLDDPVHQVRGGERVSQVLSTGIWMESKHQSEFWVFHDWKPQRVQHQGQLHAANSWVVGFKISPSDWLSPLELTWSSGRHLDVDADRLGRGQTLSLSGRVFASLPGGWGLEWEPLLSASRILHSDGASLREWTGQSMAVLHMSPRDTLRLLWQGGQAQRRGGGTQREPSPFEERHHGLSLMLQHRRSLGEVFSLGCQRQGAQPDAQRSWECFAKLSVEHWQ
ncbi:DUF5916 domain-containing protein [Roseateles sp. BYS180W]|uniref:DUF5916 domain-containing protein n=1 Tax=Roseateles rivi TaxID=3299028 RepID=A0ABW7FUL6_9BURK